MDLNVAPVWLLLPGSEGIYNQKLHLHLEQQTPGLENALETTAVEFRSRFDAPSPNLFQSVKLEKLLDSVPLKQLTSWFHDCNTGHTKCSGLQKDVELPTRVLDLDTMPSADIMTKHVDDWEHLFLPSECRLVETNAGQLGKYATLSYCWGSGLPFMTTKETLPSRKSGISFRDLPKTLQDAVMIARYLGIRYIWIDCLAIVQDDAADWEKESAVMADIYSNSYINIAASNASHCGAGFLGPRRMPMTKRVEICDEEGDLELYLVAQQTRSQEPVRDPLYQRAWVLQEQLLPTRSIHFGSDNMLWRCPNGIEHEEQSRQWTHLYTLSAVVTCIGLPPGASFGQDAWFQLVRDYTSRGITYSKDKFPAIAGVMTVLRRMTGDTSYAGLWKHNFLKWLLWIPKHDVAPFKRPANWTAPSWSFMSGDGPVDYSLGALSTDMNAWLREFCATLEECSVTPKGLNALGELTTGFARITGSVVALTGISKNSAQYTYFSCSVQMRDQKAHPARVLFDVEIYERCDVLVIAPAFGIATICTNQERSEYVRVGLVVIQRVDLNQTKGNPEEWYPEASDYPEARSIVLL
ncbi:hypothetical protein ACET3X_009685 [Alternaria dauci]|uniref:Heterokaryon incompatibility domain-containing protein n=1 Tax=Alternaria dauci TaxID=48095 RepID=A0ABR3U6R0_9PLEO